MPLYEYACKDCGQESELLVFGEETPQCPSCESEELTKLYSTMAARTQSESSLPVCSPAPSAGCGLPQCGGGQCAMD